MDDLYDKEKNKIKVTKFFCTRDVVHLEQHFTTKTMNKREVSDFVWMHVFQLFTAA